MMFPERENKEKDEDNKKEKKPKLPGKENKTPLADESNEKKKGEIVSELINQGYNFMPDVMFENIVEDYKFAQETYGDSIIRLISEYSPDYIEKNIKVPEFKRELKKKLEDKKEELLKDFNKKGTPEFQEELYDLAAKVLIVEELSKFKHLIDNDFSKEFYHSLGEVADVLPYKSRKVNDINIRKTINLAVKRNRKKLTGDDLYVNLRKSENKPHVCYAIDSSSSMKGYKIHAAKKAAIALGYKTLLDKGKISLLSFTDEASRLTDFLEQFYLFSKEVVKIKPKGQTNIAKAIIDAKEMFKGKKNNILFLITDFEPTEGDFPEKDTIEAASQLKSLNIKLVMVGINLGKDGVKLAQDISEASNGEFLLLNTKALDNLDVILLEKYEEFN